MDTGVIFISTYISASSNFMWIVSVYLSEHFDAATILEIHKKAKSKVLAYGEVNPRNGHRGGMLSIFFAAKSNRIH